MINTNTVKALLTFYLKVRLTRWGIPIDEKLQLPTDEKKLDKIKLVCKLYYNLHHHSQDKEYLLKFCDELEKIEIAEKESHHSRFAPSLSDYPLMACTIRALRSHILNAASPHHDAPEEVGLKAYLNGEFLNVIKYEDYHYTGNQLKDITSTKEFVDLYKNNPGSYSLLDRVYLLNYKARHNDRKESFAAKAAMGVIESTDSDNKKRTTCMGTLFAEKTDRKAAKAARPALHAIDPQKPRSSLEEISKIIADLDAATAKDKAWPVVGMGKK